MMYYARCENAHSGKIVKKFDVQRRKMCPMLDFTFLFQSGFIKNKFRIER